MTKSGGVPTAPTEIDVNAKIVHSVPLSLVCETGGKRFKLIFC